MMYEKEVDYCPKCYHVYDTEEMIFVNNYYVCTDCFRMHWPKDLIAIMERQFVGTEPTQETILSIEAAGLSYSVRRSDGLIEKIYIPKYPEVNNDEEQL